MLTTILSFLAVLGVLIFIHELGHYHVLDIYLTKPDILLNNALC